MEPKAKTPALAEEKTRKEIEKLQAETDAIRKPFYQKHEFYTALTPIFLALLGLYVTYRSGWFDVQSKGCLIFKVSIWIIARSYGT